MDKEGLGGEKCDWGGKQQGVKHQVWRWGGRGVVGGRGARRRWDESFFCVDKLMSSPESRAPLTVH